MRTNRILIGGFVLVVPLVANAFVREVSSPSGNAAHWTTSPIVYSFNSRGTPEIFGTQEFDAVRVAFATWDAVPNSGLAFSEAGSLVSNGASASDGVNTILWIDDPSHRLLQARGFIAATLTTFSDITGIISDTDLVFDGAHFTFTVSADGNTTTNSGPFDIQEVATHEIGHWIGLDHVSTRGSVMFPGGYPGSITLRTLTQDELSAAQFIYPPVSPPPEATISGTVTRSGVGVKRAYVEAFQNGAPIVGVLTDAVGAYTMRRVPAGTYLIRVQPYTNSTPGNGGWTSSAFYGNPTNVDVDFLAVWFPNATQESAATLVTATAGSNTPNINFAVSATGSQADPFEADGTFGTAKVIGTAGGQSQLKHFYSASPGGAGDEDWGTYTATAGRLYVIDTRNLGLRRDDSTTDTRTMADLYDQTGTTVLKSNTSRNRLESQPGSRIAYRDPASGTRYVRIRPRDSSAAGAGAGAYYELAVREYPGPFSAPTITSVVANQANQTGGVVVTIQGTNFLPGATATFGGTAASEEDAQNCATDTDCHSLKVLIPAHAPGLVSVQVTNPDGQSASLANGFTYLGTNVGKFADGTGPAFGDNIGNGRTVCWGDYDGDGDPDLFNPYTPQNSPSTTGILWRNNGDGTLTDVTTAAGLDTTSFSFISSCAWGDYDNDGDLDLYIVYSGIGSSNRLYRNNGNGTFTNIAATALVTGSTSFAKVDAAWADYDRDGRLDLYLVYASGGTNQLFHNNGNGTFTDLAGSAGVAAAGQAGRILWADYDNDGFDDFYLIRRSGQPDFLYHNNGNSTFTDATKAAGMVEGPNCFDAAWADFNNDGFLDLLCIGDSLPGSQPQRFWINQKNGTFVDQAAASGINSLGRHGTALTVLDKDNDGTVDAFFGCSALSGFPNAVLDALLQNNGAAIPVFTNVSIPAGSSPSGVDESAFPRDASAAAAADFNGDGFTDILVTGAASGFDDDAYLWKNISNTNQWLRVRLHGTISNSWGLGASVTVISDYPPTDTPTEAQCLAAATSVDARRQEVLGGSLNQNSMELEFGLGTRILEIAQADCVIVSWPKSGLKRAYTRIGVNNLLDITEDNPTTTVTSIAPPSGTTAGGTPATITGFLFKSGATVTVGGSAAAVSMVYGSYPCPDAADPTPCFHFIDITTPAHSAGAVDVTVANPSGPPATLVGGYTYVAPGTTINLTVNKDPVSNGVKLTWNDIGQGRYRVRRATGPTPADFTAGFRIVVSGTQYVDASVLGDAQSYYYKVDEGAP